MGRAKARREASSNAMVKIAKGPVRADGGSGTKNAKRIDSYVCFDILDNTGVATERVTLNGYTITMDGKSVYDYSFSRPFKDAPRLGTLAELADSLTRSFLKNDTTLATKIETVINQVKGLPGIGEIMDLNIVLTDLTFRENAPATADMPSSCLIFGLGFEPRDGWSVGSVKITGFGFRYTHEFE